MAVIKVTHENFKEIVSDCDKKVILDFWADWCGPCQMIAPYLAEIASEHPEIIVGKVNVDEEPAIAAAYGIVSIPTLIKFQNGKNTDQHIGYAGKESLTAWIMK